MAVALASCLSALVTSSLGGGNRQASYSRNGAHSVRMGEEGDLQESFSLSFVSLVLRDPHHGVPPFWFWSKVPGHGRKMHGMGVGGWERAGGLDRGRQEGQIVVQGVVSPCPHFFPHSTHVGRISHHPAGGDGLPYGCLPQGCLLHGQQWG